MKRTKSQNIGDVGETIASYIATKNGSWISRKVDKDFGIDMELELVENELVTGHYVKVQVKSTESIKITNEEIKFQIENSFLKYSHECRVPILLLVIDKINEKGYYIWVQEYLRNNKLKLTNQKTSNINIPIENDFNNGLQGQIKEIASGENQTQLQLDLKACKTSAFLLGASDIYEKLAQISFDIAKTNSLEISQVIDDLVELGNNACGTFEGNKKSTLLYDFCRNFGDKFTVVHIKRMVIRDSSYSRVGINALGILYDNYSHYIKTLDLPKAFEESDVRIVYYCLLREKYLGKNISSLLNKGVDFRINNLNINESTGDLFMKYINRGESAFLDYVYLED